MRRILLESYIVNRHLVPVRRIYVHQMGDRQLAEAYCDRVYEKALREKAGKRNWPRAAMALSLLAGQVERGDYDIYLKLVQVGGPKV